MPTWHAHYQHHHHEQETGIAVVMGSMIPMVSFENLRESSQERKTLRDEQRHAGRRSVST
jgi:hypothetical protein